MNHPEKPQMKYGLIAMLVILMVAAVVIIGKSFSEGQEFAETQWQSQADPAKTEQPILSEAGVFEGRDQRARFVDLTQRGTRTLADYYDRRAYPGAPPSIPHEVSSDMQTDFNACQACHAKGGFAPVFGTYAPVTPHAEYQNCRQCHVPQTDRPLFAETNWQAQDPPSLGRAALPGGPPPIPHQLQMRENCSACHAGPSAPAEIRTSHPERLYCRQCHVPATTETPFTR
ncbi:Periplasmic nitrate reductase, electron transfer subunit [Sulfidibacter corallicola]|uniref:Nitrate reductase cytochrome c-type subunit n=1 Tax=Sulfidibacter corallicola TaxID=2818388 RepID=A0A8A4TQV2_SULCO|nr:nitrate reductase cytochrome c-type subunit [Sulfidibacter corallicola]QTD51331.1 nitrate reductase cytochrome c-type subunit [Sulfidibacter corallicola]